MILVKPRRWSLARSGCETHQESMVKGSVVRSIPSLANAAFNRDNMTMNISALLVLSRPCFGQKSQWRGKAIWLMVNTIPSKSCPRITLCNRPLYQRHVPRNSVPNRSMTLLSMENVIPALDRVAALLSRTGLRCSPACLTINRMRISFRSYPRQSFH